MDNDWIGKNHLTKILFYILKIKNAAFEQTTREKANCCSYTVFSLYLTTRKEKITPQNYSLFAPLPVSA